MASTGGTAARPASATDATDATDAVVRALGTLRESRLDATHLAAYAALPATARSATVCTPPLLAHFRTPADTAVRQLLLRACLTPVLSASASTQGDGFYAEAASAFEQASRKTPHATWLRINAALASSMATKSVAPILLLADELKALGSMPHLETSPLHLCYIHLTLTLSQDPQLEWINQLGRQDLLESCARLASSAGFTSGDEQDSQPAETERICVQIIKWCTACIDRSTLDGVRPGNHAMRCNIAANCIWLCARHVGMDAQPLVRQALASVDALAQSIALPSTPAAPPPSAAAADQSQLFASVCKSEMIAGNTVARSLFLWSTGVRDPALLLAAIPSTSPIASSVGMTIITGYVHYEAGRYQEAFDSFVTTVSKLSDPAKMLNMMGCSLIKLNKPQSALVLIRESFQQCPSDASTMINLASVARLLGHTRLEIQLLTRLTGKPASTQDAMDAGMWDTLAARLTTALRETGALDALCDMCSQWRAQGYRLSQRVMHEYVYALIKSRKHAEAFRVCRALVASTVQRQEETHGDWRACLYMGEAAVGDVSSSSSSESCGGDRMDVIKDGMNALRRALVILGSHRVQDETDSQAAKRRRLSSDTGPIQDSMPLPAKQSYIIHIHRNLGLLLSLSGCLAASLDAFERALSLCTDTDLELHGHVCLVLVRMGRPAAAARRWQAAQTQRSAYSAAHADLVSWLDAHAAALLRTTPVAR